MIFWTKVVFAAWTTAVLATELDFELMNACAEGEVSEVERLLSEGADPKFATKDGETPLHVTGISGSSEIVKLLVQEGADIDKRVTSTKGLFMTPLTWMVYGVHADGVEALLKLGASPDVVVVDEVGTFLTALDIADDRVNSEDIARIIRAHGGRHFRDIPEHERSLMMPQKRPEQDL